MKTDRGTPTLALSKLLSRYFGAARFAYNGSTDSISITQHEPWPFPCLGSDRPVWQIGRVFSNDHRTKLSIAATKRGGRPHTDESKAKMSVVQKKLRAENPMSDEITARLSLYWGRKPSAEAKANMSAGQKEALC